MNPNFDNHIGKLGINFEFVSACRKGQFDEVKYFLTDRRLTSHADINTENNAAIKNACKFGHLEIVKYLLTSSELKEHANIYASTDSAFILACTNYRLDVIKYLIFEYNIQKTEEINKYLTEIHHPEIINWFVQRDLNIELNENLPLNQISETIAKNKI